MLRRLAVLVCLIVDQFLGLSNIIVLLRLAAAVVALGHMDGPPDPPSSNITKVVRVVLLRSS